jgi:hypothetical protein
MVTVGHFEDAERGIDDKGRYWRKDKKSSLKMPMILLGFLFHGD